MHRQINAVSMWFQRFAPVKHEGEREGTGSDYVLNTKLLPWYSLWNVEKWEKFFAIAKQV